MISGIVLAAGTSSRMGRPKQLLELGDRPLLQHVIDAAVEAGLDEVVVVLGHEAESIAQALTLEASVRTVLNPDYASGQSASLRTGLDALDPGSETAIVLLGDQPLIDSAAIRKVLDAFRSASQPIVRAVWEGTPGHPVVVARSEWEDFRNLSGDKGARDLLSSSSNVKEVEMGGPPVGDVDTWDQYQGLKSEL